MIEDRKQFPLNTDDGKLLCAFTQVLYFNIRYFTCRAIHYYANTFIKVFLHYIYSCCCFAGSDYSLSVRWDHTMSHSCQHEKLYRSRKLSNNSSEILTTAIPDFSPSNFRAFHCKCNNNFNTLTHPHRCFWLFWLIGPLHVLTLSGNCAWSEVKWCLYTRRWPPWGEADQSGESGRHQSHIDTRPHSEHTRFNQPK